MYKQKLHLLGAACICSLTFMAPGATAANLYDQNVTNAVIFGSGNGNGFFTVDKGGNGIELGLRGKVNGQGVYNSNGAGTYTFDAGTAWNVEFSVNSNWDGTGDNLSALGNTYQFGYVSGPSGSPINAFNPANIFSTVLGAPDHSFGTNATTQSNGVEAASIFDVPGFVSLQANNNLAQNSQPASFATFAPLGGFDPDATGTYKFYLEALDSSGASLARTDIDIQVVPIPAAAWLFGSALLGLVAVKRKKA